MKYGFFLWFQCVTDGWVLPVNVNRNIVLPMRPFEKKSISKYSSKDLSQYSSKKSEPSKDLSKEVSNYHNWLLGSNNTGTDTRFLPDECIIVNATEKKPFQWLDWFYMYEKVTFLENPHISINEKLEKTSQSYIQPFNLLSGLWNEFADNHLLL
jgi:hypothetical protein